MSAEEADQTGERAAREIVSTVERTLKGATGLLLQQVYWAEGDS
jgi:hypothetical protein